MSFQPLKEQKQLHSDYKNGVYKLLRRLSWVFSGLFVLLAFVIYPLNTTNSYVETVWFINNLQGIYKVILFNLSRLWPIKLIL
jgi:ATP/ADP translocase